MQHSTIGPQFPVQEKRRTQQLDIAKGRRSSTHIWPELDQLHYSHPQRTQSCSYPPNKQHKSGESKLHTHYATNERQPRPAKQISFPHHGDTTSQITIKSNLSTTTTSHSTNSYLTGRIWTLNRTKTHKPGYYINLSSTRKLTSYRTSYLWQSHKHKGIRTCCCLTSVKHNPYVKLLAEKNHTSKWTLLPPQTADHQRYKTRANGQ